MSFFTSSKEKQLWLYALVVLLTIVSTLFIGHPLLASLASQDVQAVFFLLGMLLVGATILVHGLKIRPSKTELVIWLGLAAVYLLFFLRLGLPERSHLIEYSVLAIFIHKALTERTKQQPLPLKPAIFAFLITVLVGVVDESIQLLLPNRVFDPIDIQFNSLVIFMAIGSSFLLEWVRKKMRKS